MRFRRSEVLVTGSSPTVVSTRRRPFPRWLAGPIRGRTTAVAVLVVSAALIIGAGGLLRILRNNLSHNISDTVRLRAADIATLVKEDRLPQPLAFPGEDSGLVQVLNASGTVIASTANLAGEPPIAKLAPPVGKTEIHTFHSLPIGDGHRFRVVAQRVVTKSGPVVIYTAASLEPADDVTQTVQQALLFGIPFLVLLVGVTTWMLTGVALEPVEGIRREVLKITAGRLDRRVSVPATGDEISRLAQTMNDMLDRLHASANRQRQFVADASHELRNPLTAMRATLEVNAAHPQTADWIATTDDLLQDHDRLERIVSDLLMLAKIDAAVARSAIESVDLSLLIESELDRRPAGRATLRRHVQPAVTVSADPHHIAQVLRNLVDNADRHARSEVEVHLEPSGRSARLRVFDDGSGVPVPDRDRVFERFTRLDDARDRDHGGSGLGLAIVADLVRSYGGTVSIVEDPRTCFEVWLPLADQ